MEPFAIGDPVTRDDFDHTMGRIVGISEDGRTVDVRWHTRPGLDHQVTREDLGALRRVHESEEGMV